MTESEQSVYEALLHAAMAEVGSDAGSVQVVDEERRGLHLVAWRGFAPASAAFWEFVGEEPVATCGAALAVRKRVVVADVEAVPAFSGSEHLREWRRSRLRAVQSTPLRARDGGVVGMFSTHWREPYTPSNDELERLDLLAAAAAEPSTWNRTATMRDANAGMFEVVTQGRNGSTPRGSASWRFLCECSDPDCKLWVDVDLDEYEAIRSRGEHVLASGHLVSDTEAIRRAARRLRADASALRSQAEPSAGDVRSSGPRRPH